MKKVENVIKITCDTKDKLKLDELTEFQGELKYREQSDIDKCVNSIKKYGFAVPFFCWKHDGINHILDGHNRMNALRKLDNLGYLIPPLPVVYVDCEDEKSARDLLLRINSQYGKMSAESVLEFIGDFDIDVTNFELPSGVIKFDEDLPDIDFGDEASDEQKEKHLGILVSCETEHEMEQVFMKLQKMGLNCRMVE